MINDDWKVRAMDRRLENKALKKRINELIKSRDGWHSKSMTYKNENDDLRSKLEAIKKKINQINDL